MDLLCIGTKIMHRDQELLESLKSKYDSTTAQDGYILDYLKATSVSND